MNASDPPSAPVPGGIDPDPPAASRRQPPGYDVFISHSSKDKAAADATCHALEARGIRCWIAPRDIRPGANWGESILGAISSVRIMALLLSGNANDSPQIQREVERAVHHGTIIIPMRIEDVMPAKSLEYFLSTSHWLDAFRPPFDPHLERLADTVQGILGQEAVPRAVPLPALPPRGGGKTPIIAGAIGVAALAAAALWWQAHHGQNPASTPAPVASAVAPTPVATASPVALASALPAPGASAAPTANAVAAVPLATPSPGVAAGSAPPAATHEEEETNPLRKAAAEAKRKSQQAPAEVQQKMLRDYARIFANKAKYLATDATMDVYVVASMDQQDRLLGAIAPSYPDVEVGVTYFDFSKLKDEQRELAMSSEGKILTMRGRFQKDKLSVGLGLIFYPMEVRPVDTATWNKP